MLPLVRGARGGRCIQLPHVFLDHPFGAEAGGDGFDALLNNLEPSAWNAIQVALVEQRYDLLFQQPEQLLRIVSVLRLGVRSLRQGLNAPSVGAVVPLLPPTIEDTEVNHAVERGLLAAGPARLEWGSRSVQPDIDALHQVLCHMHVIVFEESDVTTEFVIVAETQHLVNEVAPRFVGRVRFACKHDLDGPPPIVEQLFESVEIAEEECRTFVGREPSGKSDREGFRVQQRSPGDRLHGLEMAANPAVPRALANKPHQFASRCLSNGPKSVIRQVRDPLPNGGVIDPFRPVRAEIFGIEGVRLRGDPGGRVDAVGEAADRDEVLRQARPQVLPHLSRDSPVLAAHAVDVGRQPHRKGGHVEAVSCVFRRFAQA